ncbi:hypothetical protein ABF176_002292 [Flavobacterium psychrophilum]
MNKFLKLTAFSLLTTITLSCNNKNINSENNISNDTQKEEIKTLSSFKFINSYSKDVFFADDNLDKEFKITDVLVEGYDYNPRKKTCILYCTPFDKETYTSTCETTIAEKFIKSLNGKKIKQLYLDKGYKMIVYLNNPKDLKKLKVFKSDKEYQSSLTSGGYFPSVYEIKDLKNITGKFKGLEDGVLVFVNGDILD